MGNMRSMASQLFLELWEEGKSGGDQPKLLYLQLLDHMFKVWGEAYNVRGGGGQRGWVIPECCQSAFESSFCSKSTPGLCLEKPGDKLQE